MGSQIGAIVTGILLASLFAVLIFEGADQVNQQYEVDITNQSYQTAVSKANLQEQKDLVFEVSDTAPGGDNVPTDTTGLADVEKSTKGTLSAIFGSQTLVRKVVVGNETDRGIAPRIGIDPRITGTFITIFILTIALILIRAFIKNPI